ncbi:hypothetical protein [Candidatus Phycosocius spiralis]|uniref:hypothetical protein n=1 Tax=Candidatus Phycosocius spiralis TaxID=2815099 RepID=UPI0024E0EC56|nr:hypothetical protein [Candidatus Phycosocius spiralis]
MVSWMFDGNVADASNNLSHLDFQGDIRISKVVTQPTGPKSAAFGVNIGEVNLLGVHLSQGDLKASSLAVINVEIEDADLLVRIGKIYVTELKNKNWLIHKKPHHIQMGDPEYNDLNMGSLVIGELNVDVKPQTTKDQDRKLFASVDRIEAANWTDKNIGQFGISGLKAKIGSFDKPIDVSLESFSMRDINLPYFSSFGEAIANELPNMAPKSNGLSTHLDQAELHLLSSTPKAVAPSASTAAPSQRLKDLLPGGPLDVGISGMSLSNLAVDVTGFKFTIDKINSKQGRNSAGIITSSQLDPMTMKLTFPEAMFLNEPNGPTALFMPLIADGIELVLNYNATYEPTTDVMSVSQAGYEFKGWARINLALALDGLSHYFQEQTVQTAAQTMLAALRSSQAPQSDTKPNNTDVLPMLKSALAPFQSIRLLNGRLELIDQGGIDKVAGLFAAMIPTAEGTTSRTIEKNTRVIKQVRQSWAIPLHERADQKDRPEVERIFMHALARWLEVGGVMTAVLQPPEPVTLPSLVEPYDLTKRLGMTFTNQLPAKN